MSPADAAGGEDAADAADALDLMLADAALGTWRWFVPGMVASARSLLSYAIDALLLSGANDPLIPVVNGRTSHRALPHSTLVVYDGGHLDVDLRAPQVVPHINRFVLDQPAAPTTT